MWERFVCLWHKQDCCSSLASPLQTPLDPSHRKRLVPEASSTTSSMLLPTMLLMLSAGLREAYPSVPLRYGPYSDDESPQQAALKALKGLDPPPSTLSTPLALELLSPLLEAPFQRRALLHPDTAHLKAKKQQNPPSYNWNSFGLRYGK